jgi:predicted transcriptional regulator
MAPSLPLGAIFPKITWYENRQAGHVRPADPAVSVMTDFHDRPSVTVCEGLTIDAALEHMKHAGVRCAFVTDQQRRSVLGLITAYDIMGEKPTCYMNLVGTTRAQVLVRDLMEALADWHVMDIKIVQRLTVAAIAQVLVHLQLTHLPVVESTSVRSVRLRGMLSAAKISRLLAAGNVATPPVSSAA